MVETCLEPHSHPQFLIIPTLSTSLELFTSTHQLLCVPLCVCVCVFFGICELGVACTQFWFALSSDLWIGCCVCTILVCALAGVVCVNGVGNVCLPQWWVCAGRQEDGAATRVSAMWVTQGTPAGRNQVRYFATLTATHYVTAWFSIAARGNSALVHVL